MDQSPWLVPPATPVVECWPRSHAVVPLFGWWGATANGWRGQRRGSGETEPRGQALEGCSAVISCAGPFIRAGRPVVAGALQAGVPYTDSTGEQSFIRPVFHDLH